MSYSGSPTTWRWLLPPPRWVWRRVSFAKLKAPSSAEKQNQQLSANALGDSRN